jgi:hypothetical protein
MAALRPQRCRVTGAGEEADARPAPKKTIADGKALGYSVIPSETNFFMIHVKRPVQPVIAEFLKKEVVVGRPFPPMLDYLRVFSRDSGRDGSLRVPFEQVMAQSVTPFGAEAVTRLDDFRCGRRRSHR